MLIRLTCHRWEDKMLVGQVLVNTDHIVTVKQDETDARFRLVEIAQCAHPRSSTEEYPGRGDNGSVRAWRHYHQHMIRVADTLDDIERKVGLIL